MKVYNQTEHVLLVDKPYKWTSFDVVNKIRYAGKFKKVGHAGTLDPLATGLLILCTSKKTKQIDHYQGLEKEYTGSFVLGATTESVDLEQPINATFPVDHINEALLNEKLKQFIGTIQQTPPIHSAIKVKGKRAYEAARKGETIVLKSREVEVPVFEIESKNFPEIEFRIVCSKGTYIRSLVRDFGLALNSGAYLKTLVRTRIGEFELKDAMEIEQAVKFVTPSESIS